MIHLQGPIVLACVLIGLGIYGMLARRHAILMLLGVELTLAGAGVLLVAVDAAIGSDAHSGSVLTLFVMTIAAAEIAVALGVVVAVFRARGQADLAAPEPEEDLA